MAAPVIIPNITALNFTDMSSLELLQYLDIAVANEAAIAAAGTASITQKHKGPVYPIYSVRRQRLPPQTSTIITAINNLATVVDMTMEFWRAVKWNNKNGAFDNISNFENADKKFGNDMGIYEKEFTSAKHNKEKMEQVLDKWVTQQQQTLTPGSPGSMRSWHQNDNKYLPVNEFDEANLTAKGLLYHTYVSANKGLQNKQKKKDVDQVYTGYIEFTAGGWSTGVHDGRVCYDYLNDLFFFTATHYQIIKGREDRNPWLQVMP